MSFIVLNLFLNKCTCVENSFIFVQLVKQKKKYSNINQRVFSVLNYGCFLVNTGGSPTRWGT